MEEDLKNMRLRLIWSLVFLIPLFYLSMGHMMGWPIPAFFHGTENAMVYALTLFLLTVPTLIINQKYFRGERELAVTEVAVRQAGERLWVQVRLKTADGQAWTVAVDA